MNGVLTNSSAIAQGDYNEIAQDEGVYLGSVGSVGLSVSDNNVIGCTANKGTALGHGSSTVKRFLFNAYNQEPQGMLACPGYVNNSAADTYSTTSTTWVEANSGLGSRAEFVVGLAADIDYRLLSRMENSANVQSTSVGVAEDSATSPFSAAQTNPPTGSTLPGLCGRVWTVSIGFHFLDLLITVGGNTGTYYASAGRQGAVDDPINTAIVGSYLG